MPPPPDADPRFGRFELRTECPRCDSHLPVNGYVSEVTCADCQARLPVPKEVLTRVLDGFESGWPIPEDGGSLTLEERRWRWITAIVAAVPCPACSADLGDLPVEGPLHCPACSAPVPFERLSSSLTALLGASAWVVGTDLTPTHTARPWFVKFAGASRASRTLRLEAERAEKDRKAREERDQRIAAAAQAEAEAEARKAAERAADRVAASRYGTPLLVLAAVASFVAVSAMGFSAIWFLAARGPLLGIGDLSANLLADGMVMVAVGLTIVAWLFGVLAATRRAGVPFVPVLRWSAFMMVLSVLPLIGPLISLFFTWQHLVDAEPTVTEYERLPPFSGWPLAAIHLFGGFFSHVVYAAFVRTVLGLF